jgi:hypothetical protein
MRFYKYLKQLRDEEELEEEMTTGSVGGLSGSDVTPETNGLKKLKVIKRRRKKFPVHTPAPLPTLEIQQ